MTYEEYLAAKIPAARTAGFEAPLGDLPPVPLLFDWQQAIVQWSLRLGRAAVFAERGLGKTRIQLAWADQVARHSGRPVIILCPLAVAHQTIQEGAALDIGVTYVRGQPQVDAAPTPIVIANYEMALAGAFDLEGFGAVVLDESSRLKEFTSKTRRVLTEAFARTPYRLCCTATPSPNDTTELGQTAEFLGVMTSGEMLTRWFIRDSQHANNLRLKGHAAKAFWQWVASWAVCLSRPSDLDPRYSDEGYELPPLDLQFEQVAADHSRAWRDPGDDGQAALFVDGNRSATDLWREKRATLPARMRRAVEILATAPDEPWIIWHDTDYERDAIRAALPEATIVTGSQAPDEKEALLHLFGEGHARVMATKPRIAGWGLNWQHCNRVIWLGVTHQFEAFYQALGRTHRFGQRRPVHAHVIYAESEAGIVESLQRKWSHHEQMHAAMVAAVRDSGLNGVGPAYALETDVETETARGASWEMRRGDAVQLLREVPDASVGLSLSSWPFSDQYMYSASIADLGNCDSDQEFFTGMEFLLPELLRATIPGRMALVHAKDRIVYGTKNGGYGYIEPFSDRCITSMVKCGWLFFGRITIATDPVRENNQTNRLGFGNLQKDASRIGVGMPEYLLLFRRPHTQTAAGGTWSDAPVLLGEDPAYSLPRWQIDANSLWRSSGRVLAPWEADGYDYRAHVSAMEDADARGELGRANGRPLPADHPAVWWDIQRTRCLNNVMAREQRDERHICPLQLDICERAIARWSNPGDLVLDYFAGIGSVGVVALRQGRRALGMELKRSYYETACRYLRQAEAAAGQQTLFGLPATEGVGETK